MSLKHPTRPGQRCEIINFIAGPEGQSVGKKCVTVFLHPNNLRLPRFDENSRPTVVDLGPIWRVRGVDGQPLYSEYESEGEVDCPAIWLQVVDEPDPAETRLASRDLVLHPD